MIALDTQGFADHFTLLGLPRGYHLDTGVLEQQYRALQARVHPDKYAHLPEAERRVAMQWATRANEAFQTLKEPLSRALYLLELAGHDPEIQHNTAMPLAFLAEQMEWRETVAEARAEKEVDRLDTLLAKLRQRMKEEYLALAQTLDQQQQDYPAAAGLVRQLMFLEKLRHDIEDALEAVDA